LWILRGNILKKIFIIGGMGAGKSTASRAITDCGAEYIDLDKVGHEVLTWDVVKDDLVAEFGSDILDGEGEVNRAALAAKAFLSPAATRKLNRITMPRIEEAYQDRIDLLEEQGVESVVVEYSIFKNRMGSLAYSADVVLAVLAPVEQRIARAVESGFNEEDVRRRIARQITDADRVEAADMVFSNTTTREDLYNKVQEWWKSYNEQSE
jgi:dephospho-CoA kinase